MYFIYFINKCQSVYLNLVFTVYKLFWEMLQGLVHKDGVAALYRKKEDIEGGKTIK